VAQEVGSSVGVLVGLGVSVAYGVELGVGVQVGGSVMVGVSVIVGVSVGGRLGDAGCVNELRTAFTIAPRIIISANARIATIIHFLRDISDSSLYYTSSQVYFMFSIPSTGRERIGFYSANDLTSLLRCGKLYPVVAFSSKAD